MFAKFALVLLLATFTLQQNTLLAVSDESSVVILESKIGTLYFIKLIRVLFRD